MRRFKVAPLQTAPSQSDLRVSETGTLRMDDLLINAEGVRYASDEANGTKKSYSRPQSCSSDGKPEFTASIKLSDLEVSDVLGRGCQGIVRRALHKPSNTTIALKELRCNLTDKTVRKQLLRELHLLYEVSCPYIVPCYGIFFAEQAINIASEYMDKGCLSSIKTPLGFGPALRSVARCITSALAHLEGCRLLHRDIKPSNLLANSEGVVKLADFGLTVKTNNGVTSITSLAATMGGFGGDTFVGSIAYMSPERITDGKCYFVSDLWSAGLTLLELALGTYPYKAQGIDGVSNRMIELMDVIVSGPPSFECEDPLAKEFIESCIHVEMKNRPRPMDLVDHPWLKQGDPEDDRIAFVNVLNSL
ncbi:hypothetical protein P9112_011625 [Eukaryota sp. TZLM1-RC]